MDSKTQIAIYKAIMVIGAICAVLGLTQVIYSGDKHQPYPAGVQAIHY